MQQNSLPNLEVENNDAVELLIDTDLNINLTCKVCVSCFLLRLHGPNHRDPCVLTIHQDSIHPAIHQNKYMLDQDHLRECQVNRLIMKFDNLFYVM